MNKKVKKWLRAIKVISYLIMLFASFLCEERFILIIIALCGLSLISYIEIEEWHRGLK